MSDFCAVVRWSELTHDERGGDNTTKRLNFKLLQCRVALVEEMGQTSGINRLLETSTIKQLTGGGEIIGADLYRSEVHGEIKFKLVSLMNEAPHIEPDPAFKRRVQVFPFRARFDEVANPGCIAWPWSGRTRLPACVSHAVGRAAGNSLSVDSGCTEVHQQRRRTGQYACFGP